MTKAVIFFENQKLFTNVEDQFGKQVWIKLSYLVKICHEILFIFAQSPRVRRSVVRTNSNNCLALLGICGVGLLSTDIIDTDVTGAPMTQRHWSTETLEALIHSQENLSR
jgi:hypothetical protein